MKMIKAFNALLLSGLVLAAAPAFASESSHDSHGGGWESDNQDDLVSQLSWKEDEQDEDLNAQPKFDSESFLSEEKHDEKPFNRGGHPGGKDWTNYNIPWVAGAGHQYSPSDDSDSDSEFESGSDHSHDWKSDDFRDESKNDDSHDHPSITAVPLPPAFALFAAGLIPWFVGFKRRLSA